MSTDTHDRPSAPSAASLELSSTGLSSTGLSSPGLADPRLEALYVEDLLRRAAPPARRTPAGPPRRLTLSRLWRRLLGAPPA